jgi:hypothetical protein
MTEKRKTSSDIREKINRIYEENELAGLLQNKNRSRSLTVGTAFGGTIEISMRGDYSSLYALMQPVEVVELIEQLAASAGLQVALRPKQDFASWRGWEGNIDDRYWVGSAPWNLNAIEQEKSQKLLSPSEDFEELGEGEETPKEKQRRRNAKTGRLHEERTKQELEIQNEIRNNSSKEAKSNLQKIREESLKNLSALRKEVENDMRKKIKDSQKIHDDFIDEVLE